MGNYEINAFQHPLIRGFFFFIPLSKGVGGWFFSLPGQAQGPVRYGYVLAIREYICPAPRIRRFRRAIARIWRHRPGAGRCMVAERPDPPQRRGGRTANAGAALSRPANAPAWGLLENPSCQGTKATPPTPPCQGGMKRRHPPRWKGFCSFLSLRQGGYEKAMRFHRAEGVLIFLAPLTRGGRGGWFFSVPGQPRRAGLPRGGACPATEPSRRYSGSASPGGFFPPEAARTDTGARRK